MSAQDQAQASSASSSSQSNTPASTTTTTTTASQQDENLTCRWNVCNQKFPTAEALYVSRVSKRSLSLSFRARFFW